MIHDEATIKKLSFRSDLPRLTKEGFYLLAQLEGDEQKLDDAAKVKLLAAAFVDAVAREEARSDRPLPPLVPRAWHVTRSDDEWLDFELACGLASPFERRNRGGDVLGVAHHLKARLRLHRGAFAYFALDDVRPLDELDTSAWTPIS